jgi:hypothetical protein
VYSLPKYIQHCTVVNLSPSLIDSNLKQSNMVWDLSLNTKRRANIIIYFDPLFLPPLTTSSLYVLSYLDWNPKTSFGIALGL